MAKMIINTNQKVDVDLKCNGHD